MNTGTSTDPLLTALDRLPAGPAGRSFGADIDEAHELLLADVPIAWKQRVLLDWITRHQPCVFAKVAARPTARSVLDLCWISDADLNRGAEHVGQLLQDARIAWKQRAVAGRTSSLQVMFNSERLAFAEPSEQFVDLCLRLIELYLPEWAPIGTDQICLDGLPLRRPDGRLELYAASMTTFFTGAHRTRAHDHRVPGGVLLNVNAVGHHTWAAIDAGQYASAEVGIDRAHRTALRSVGNGGISHPERHSSTWHLTPDQPCGYGRQPARQPGYVPPCVDAEQYGALYHIDVTVAAHYADPTEALPADLADEQWTMMLDYFATTEPAEYHNSALMHGLPIAEHKKYRAPWPPELRPHLDRRF